MAAARNLRPVAGKAFQRNDGLETFVADVARMGGNVDARDDGGNTPLHLASERGDVNMVETLLKCDADPNSKNSRGDTPMHSAVRWDHAPVVRALSKWGADERIANDDGKTPLDVAREQNGSETVLRAVSSKRCCRVREAFSAIVESFARFAKMISRIRFSSTCSEKKE
jgi:hypothetical protein